MLVSSSNPFFPFSLKIQKSEIFQNPKFPKLPTVIQCQQQGLHHLFTIVNTTLIYLNITIILLSIIAYLYYLDIP